jgi:kinesin family protein 4/21/27
MMRFLMRPVVKVICTIEFRRRCCQVSWMDTTPQYVHVVDRWPFSISFVQCSNIIVPPLDFLQIMSYGQTGSGKTYTMGSEAHTEPETSSQAGLIPRFITDFFLQLQKKKEASDNGEEGSQVLLDYNLKASFLEVYGEDVYDLLDVNRHSLPLREDAEKGIVVVGLKNRTISNTTEALRVLHEGTMNRTTAATLMNLTSSRSHAVFTIQLSQVTRASNGDKVDVATTSCFTFVDLAGSERMKKTGAEGERAREGIKINEGLLALGNVINALADEERIAKEKKVHVPYRQSKLTRLLQDALGGNSQTLFLACVSPSDTNASETLSTLHYANRARNIRNAPTRNVDAAAAELRRLHAINRVLQCELVKSRFQPHEGNDPNDDLIGKIDNSLLKRKDVESYMQHIFEVACEMASPGKPPTEHSFSPRFMAPGTDRIGIEQKLLPPAVENTQTGMIASQWQLEKYSLAALDDVNPDEEMAILDYLLEIQQQDQEFEDEKKIDDEKLKNVSRELEKEEAMLLQLRESLKVYHGMKSRYEDLMVEVQQLEAEKTNLAKQLEQATADPTLGCSAAIKRKLERVEMNLSRARRETLTHRENFRRAEDQNRKCKILERKVNELKQAKMVLIKKQKESESRYREAMEAKTKQLMALKRREKATDKKVSKLEHEVRMHKTNLEKRKRYCTKLSDKLKQTEAHLMKMLAMRQRDLTKRCSISAAGNRIPNVNGSNTRASSIVDQRHSKSASEDDIRASRYIFDRMVVEKVKQSRSKKKYEELVQSYSEIMRKVVSEIKQLQQMRQSCMTDSNGEMSCFAIRDTEEHIADLELKLELLDSEIQEIVSEIPGNSETSSQDNEDAVETIMSGMSAAGFRSLLLDTFSKFVTTEVRQMISFQRFRSHVLQSQRCFASL